MIECVLKYTHHIQGNRGKTDKEPWYEYVPKSIETGYEGKVTNIVESTSEN